MKTLFRLGQWISALAMVTVAPVWAAQTYVVYTGVLTPPSTFSVGNVTGTVARSNLSGTTTQFMNDARTPLPANNPNYPLAWYTPTPVVPASATPTNPATQFVYNLLGANSSGTITYTFSGPVTDPQIALLNMDVASLTVSSGAPSAPTGSSLSIVSGNSALSLSGLTIPPSSTATNGLAGGCRSATVPIPPGEAGICGTVKIAGTYTSLSFRVNDTIAAGDSFLLTLTADVEAIGGTVAGLLPGNSVSLNLSDGNGFTQALTALPNGTFTFTPGLVAGSNYTVTLAAQPPGQTCTVTNGSGGPVLVGTPVTNVLVTCVSNAAGGPTGGAGLSEVPTVGQWALLALAGIAALLGVGGLRRR